MGLHIALEGGADFTLNIIVTVASADAIGMEQMMNRLFLLILSLLASASKCSHADMYYSQQPQGRRVHGYSCIAMAATRGGGCMAMTV